MTEEIKPVKVGEKQVERSRPVLLSVLCLFSFIYFGLVAIIFLTSALWSGRIASVVNSYVPEDIFTHSQLLLVFLGGFLINSVTFAGVVLIWRLRRTGYYLLAAGGFSMAAFQLLIPRAALTTTGLYIAMVVLFGIFFRRLK